MIHAPRTMAVPASATADSVTLSGCRGLPNEVRGSWAKRARSSAAVRHPAAMRASVSPMRWRSAPSAATNTNSTAPGTSASPRARAWNANVSAVTTAKPVPMAASSAQPPTYSTGATASWNWSRTRPRSAQPMSHVSRVGKNAANVSG